MKWMLKKQSMSVIGAWLICMMLKNVIVLSLLGLGVRVMLTISEDTKLIDVVEHAERIKGDTVQIDIVKNGKRYVVKVVIEDVKS